MRRRKKKGKIDKEEVIRRCEETRNQAMVASEMGISRQRVNQIVIWHRAGRPNTTKKWLDQYTTQEIVDAKGSMTWSEVSKKFGASVEAIRARLNREGVRFRAMRGRPSEYSKELAAEMVDLVENHQWSTHEVARLFGVSQTTVYNYIRIHKNEGGNGDGN